MKKKLLVINFIKNKEVKQVVTTKITISYPNIIKDNEGNTICTTAELLNIVADYKVLPAISPFKEEVIVEYV